MKTFQLYQTSPWAILAILSTLLSGCVTLPGTVATQHVAEGCIYATSEKNPTFDFLKFTDDKTTEFNAKLDSVLTCLAGDITKSKNTKEIPAYRAYVSLALVSRYAALNYTGQVAGTANLDFASYPDIDNDAIAFMANLQRTGYLLRANGDPSFRRISARDEDPAVKYYLLMKHKAPAPDAPNLQTAARTQLSILYLKTIVSAEKPTVARGKGILAAAAASAVAGREELLSRGASIIGKSLALHYFGDAYLKDAQNEMNRFNKDKVKPPTKADWDYWSTIIKESCTEIAAATGTTPQCN